MKHAIFDELPLRILLAFALIIQPGCTQKSRTADKAMPAKNEQAQSKSAADEQGQPTDKDALKTSNDSITITLKHNSSNATILSIDSPASTAASFSLRNKRKITKATDTVDSQPASPIAESNESKSSIPSKPEAPKDSEPTLSIFVSSDQTFKEVSNFLEEQRTKGFSLESVVIEFSTDIPAALMAACLVKLKESGTINLGLRIQPDEKNEPAKIPVITQFLENILPQLKTLSLENIEVDAAFLELLAQKSAGLEALRLANAGLKAIKTQVISAKINRLKNLKLFSIPENKLSLGAISKISEQVGDIDFLAIAEWREV